MQIHSHCFRYLRLAEACVRQAADQLADRDRQAVSSRRKNIKIRADKKLSVFIQKKLERETTYPVLSEEDPIGHRLLSQKNYLWIIDPLDGSFNFNRRIPIYCVSIALWHGMEPVLGAIYDFSHQETFSALAREGAWLNGKSIQVSETRFKEEAVLCTGFPVYGDFSKSSIARFVQKVRVYKKIRMLGSAALSLAYVASGRADVYEEEDIAIWDVAAGLALVKAAGGSFHISPTGVRHIYNVRAANRRLKAKNEK